MARARDAESTEESGLDPALPDLGEGWPWLLAMGIGLAILGVFAITSAFIATLATVILFGILLLVSGGVQTISAFWSPNWTGAFVHLVLGVLYMVVGFLMLEEPVEGAAAITLLMAALFIAGGLVRIIASLRLRFCNWGWSLLNGAITLLLGILIWKQWPLSATWVIGLFVGIDMVFSGFAWIMLALAVRSLRQSEA